MTPAERRERFEDVIETIRRVHEQPDGTGTVKCARCLGPVQYEKRGVGKRVPRRSRQPKPTKIWSRGKCETEGCLSWIV